MRISRDTHVTPPRVQHFCAFHFLGGLIVASCNNFMHVVLGEPADEAREKCPHVIASHIHEQYRHLQSVI